MTKPCVAKPKTPPLDRTPPKRQLSFSFFHKCRDQAAPRERVKPRRKPPVETSPAKEDPNRDIELENEVRQWLDDLGMHEGAIRVRVIWNTRLRSTAGFARWPQWRIELNPKLHDFEGQVERTLKHELAHLIAYSRAGRRHIDAHGPEWKLACEELGIGDETAQHNLPLPRTTQTRKFHYQCPACRQVIDRVRPFRRKVACLACCKKHNEGRYDARYMFIQVEKSPKR